jgi:hypothetical protein
MMPEASEPARLSMVVVESKVLRIEQVRAGGQEGVGHPQRRKWAVSAVTSIQRGFCSVAGIPCNSQRRILKPMGISERAENVRVAVSGGPAGGCRSWEVDP